MREAGAVIDLKDEVLYHHLPHNRTGGSLPDSVDLWDILWTNRHNLKGFAHSHPGSGIPGPSWEDLTTFAAVEAGLGRRLTWWITSSDTVIELEWVGPAVHDYAAAVTPDANVPWIQSLRSNSEMNERT